MERAVYRIIDANFNRAREAARVMEDYCRFALGSAALSGRAKQLRHELSAAVGKLDAGRLIAGRDTLADVGVGRKIKHQMLRASLKDAFVAASKRLTEALRVLTETAQPLNPPAAEEIEKLRYGAYTLEKDIVFFSDAGEKFKDVRLYVIISSNVPADVLSLAARCAAGGADCLQLRAKNAPDDTLFALSCEFVKLCRDAGVVSIINDRVDIAAGSGADGVHLGQNDLPVEQARRIEPVPFVSGKSTHSAEQLGRAIDELVTYVGLGPVFPTPTKPGAEPVGLDYVRRSVEVLADTGIGHAAIGGITLDNVEDVLRAGAKTIAVCSAITQVDDPRAACQRFVEKIASFAG